MLARLSHTGLVTVFDAGFGNQSAAGVPGQAFLVMELVEGPTMARLMADGPLPLPELAAIGAQVAEALAYVHSRGVIHRDVKPANVLQDKDQRVKLADFGIARLLGQTSRNTRPGQAVGTAAYLAPEQVQGGEVDGAADVYSLGLVLLEAVTGRREYAGSTTEAALARLTRPPAIPAELPQVWRDLLEAMTRIDPALRPSAEDVAATLRSEASAAAPVGVEIPEDAAPAPEIQADIQADIEADIRADDAGGPTQPMTVLPGEPPAIPPPLVEGAAPPTVSTPPPPRTSVFDRAGDALSHGAGRSLRRLRTMPSDAIAIAGTLAVLVLLLVVAAIAADSGSEPDLPDNTPSELRQPLEDLHEAINGEDG